MVLTHKSKTTPGHIIIMRLSAMGDVAMTVPVVRALRCAYPELRITLLTRPFFQPFFRDVPGIEFLKFDPAGRHKGFLGLIRLAADIRSTGVDAVADLHDVIRTKVVRWMLFLTGIPFANLDKDRRARKLLTQRVGKVFEQLTPIPEAYAKVFERLGFHFPMDSCVNKEVRPLPEKVAEMTGAKRGVWVGIAPFAKHKGKIYPMDLTDRLIGLLAERYRKVFIFGGGSFEQAFADEIDKRYDNVVSVIGKVSLSEEMDVIGNLDAMIVMDSASMHMASLVGIPAISVWGATHPYAGFYGWGQNPADAVQLQLSCRPCSVYGNKACIFGDYRCMRDIEPTMIIDALERRLAAVKRSRLKAARESRRKAEAMSTPEAVVEIRPEADVTTSPKAVRKTRSKAAATTVSNPEMAVESRSKAEATTPDTKTVRKPRSKASATTASDPEMVVEARSKAEETAPSPKTVRKPRSKASATTASNPEMAVEARPKAEATTPDTKTVRKPRSKSDATSVQVNELILFPESDTSPRPKTPRKPRKTT